MGKAELFLQPHQNKPKGGEEPYLNMKDQLVSVKLKEPEDSTPEYIIIKKSYKDILLIIK